LARPTLAPSFALFVAASSLCSCVTQARHEALLNEATAAERARADRHQKDAEELERARKHAERELDLERDRAAELELQLAQNLQALQASRELVDQLRGELGRVGGHLEHFGGRAKLATELERRVEFLERRMLAIIKLANRLVETRPGKPARTARIGLSKEGDLIIDVRTKALFNGASSQLTRQGRTLLAQLAPLAGGQLGLSLSLVRAPGVDAENDTRTEKLKELLIEAGAAEGAVSIVEADKTVDEDAFRFRLGFGAPAAEKPEATPQPEAAQAESPPSDA
jgi:hypothetical protein